MNNPFRFLRLRAILPLLGFCLLVLAACDSGNALDQSGPEEVAGTYRFTQFEFVPTATVLPAANVLDTLTAAATSVRLTNGGDFVFSYQLRGGLEQVLSGSYDVTATRVRLTGQESDAAKYGSLLLDRSLSFERSTTNPDVLTAQVSKTINLAAFSNRYQGIGDVQGTLRLRLER